VLKPDGFAEIRVPDLRAVMLKVVRDNLDLDAVLYKLRRRPDQRARRHIWPCA
jgi:hypothetical protein